MRGAQQGTRHLRVVKGRDSEQPPQRPSASYTLSRAAEPKALDSALPALWRFIDRELQAVTAVTPVTKGQQP